MVYLKIRLPDVLFDALQASGTALDQNWEQIIQRALEQYLEDFDDLTASARRLRRPRRVGLDPGHVVPRPRRLRPALSDRRRGR